jgi:hypothetical protein
MPNPFEGPPGRPESPRIFKCPKCDGTGKIKGEKCGRCDGTGKIRDSYKNLLFISDPIPR